MDQDHFLFVEKYRPRTIDECILPVAIKNTFKGYVKQGRIPHLLVAGSAGGGKSTISKALCNEIGVDYIVINGSLDNGIDILRTKILSFASTISLTDAKKVVIIDEADYLNCLEENETIQIGTTKHHTETKLSDLSIGIEYPVVSFNMNTREFENDVGVIVSDTYKEVFEVTLENGQTILVTEDHPFIIQDKDDIKECSIKDGITEKDIVLRQ